MSTITIEDIARVCHETNRAIQIFNLDAEVSLPWGDAPEWQRESAVKGVQVALDGATAEELHAAWFLEKSRTGWIYAPVKNTQLKLHPCMVPYAELPPNEKLKDLTFTAIVNAMKPLLATVYVDGEGLLD